MDKNDARKRIIARIEITDSGCWEWILAVRSNGYARVTYKRESWYAHRLSYIAFNDVESIPVNIDVCHKCDNRKCVNPSHLFLGTRADNMADANRKGRISRGDNHSIALTNSPNRKTKLTKENVYEIHNLFYSGMKKAHIARKFGIDKSQVGNIINGKSWRRIWEDLSIK